MSVVILRSPPGRATKNFSAAFTRASTFIAATRGRIGSAALHGVILLLLASCCIPLAAQKKPPAKPIELNAATLDQLEQLPGVGPAIAKSILDFRKKSGPFRRPEDLLSIRGISAKRYQAIAPYIIVSPAKLVSSAASARPATPAKPLTPAKPAAPATPAASAKPVVPSAPGASPKPATAAKAAPPRPTPPSK